jgi:glyoxylase-like metal-dependent hydrolase (beta-lactamase superfamily II)
MRLDQGMSSTAWTEPGAFPVAPGVWRIPLPLPNDGLRAVNVYAIETTDGFTLIDGGWALDIARDGLAAALATLGGGLRDIRRFLVTHAHRDHYTQAVAIRRDFGATVLIGSGERGTIDLLAADPPPGFDVQVRALARHGGRPVIEALRALGLASEDGKIADLNGDGYEQPDAYIAAGEQFPVGDRILEAIATPGHTAGHLVYVDRAAGLMFAGDHVLPHITPSVAFEPNPPELALRSYLASLRLVREMPDMQLLPAHGPAGEAVHARVDELLAHHARRLADALRILSVEGRTSFDVAGQIGWTSRARKFADLDPINQMLAIVETALHLDLLVAQGLAEMTEVDGVQLYHRP